MKTLIAPLLTFAATPALAHSGIHIHPHADDASWLPLLFWGLLTAAVASLIWARLK